MASETPKISCDKVIEAADKALKEKQDVIEAGDKALQKCKEESQALKDVVEAKESKINNPLRQPITLLGAGIIGTVVGGPLVAGVGAILVVLFLK